MYKYMMTYMISREYVDDRGIRNVWWYTRMNDESKERRMTYISEKRLRMYDDLYG